MATAGGEIREVCALDRLWNFALSWEHDVLLVSVAGSQPELWRMNLDGRNARRVTEGVLVRHLQLAPGGDHAVYELQDAIWSLDLATGKARRIVEHGKVPALSPDGRTVAFKKAEPDLYIQSMGGAVETVVSSQHHDESWRRGSYLRPPLWSPDGRLLLFCTTVGTRLSAPRHPEFVASMRRRKAAAEVRKARGQPTRRNVDYDGTIEHAHWAFEHSMGLVDWQTRQVWMREGYWEDAAWAPAP
jgi:hypothetical protein